MYKVGMSIAVSVLPTALFYCCDPDLRTYIICDLWGDVAIMVEVDLLAAILRDWLLRTRAALSTS